VAHLQEFLSTKTWKRFLEKRVSFRLAVLPRLVPTELDSLNGGALGPVLAVSMFGDD